MHANYSRSNGELVRFLRGAKVVLRIHGSHEAEGVIASTARQAFVFRKFDLGPGCEPFG